MKILAINSSFRGDNGYTSFLIEKLFEGAREAGAICESITLAKLKINHCIDCQVCQTESHFLKCVHQDDVEMVFNKMRDADLIIFATPVYVFNISSLLKTLLERYYSTCSIGDFKFTKSGLIFHDVDEAMCSKPFVVLITCDNMLNETTHSITEYFKIYAKFNDARIAGMLVRKQGSLIGHGKNPVKEKNFPIIYEIYDAYRQAGKELTINGFIDRSTQKRANRLIIQIPFFAKYLMKFKPFQEEAIKKHALMIESAIHR